MQNVSSLRQKLKGLCKSRTVRIGNWIVRITLLLVVAIWFFNVCMYFRARQEAKQIASDSGYGQAFESLDYHGKGDLGVLLFHGIHGTPQDFKLLLEELRKRQIHYYAPMLGGDRPSPAAGLGFTEESLSRHAIKSYDNLSPRCDRIVVVGFSLGGVLATDVASSHHVSGLVLVSPAYGITKRWYLFPSTDAWVRALAPAIPLLPKSRPAIINDPASSKEYRGLNTASLPAVVALLDHSSAVLAHSERVRAPVLCLLSMGDSVVDISAAQAGIGSLGSQTKRIAWYNKADHNILWDYGRQEASQEILDFIMLRRSVTASTALGEPVR